MAGAGKWAVSLSEFRCALDMAPPIESHPDFSIGSFALALLFWLTVAGFSANTSTVSIRSCYRLLLQQAINLLRYREGSIIKHCSQYPHIGRFQRLLGLVSGHSSGRIRLQHEHDAVRLLSQQHGIVVHAD